MPRGDGGAGGTQAHESNKLSIDLLVGLLMGVRRPHSVKDDCDDDDFGVADRSNVVDVDVVKIVVVVLGQYRQRGCFSFLFFLLQVSSFSCCCSSASWIDRFLFSFFCFRATRPKQPHSNRNEKT